MTPPRVALTEPVTRHHVVNVQDTDSSELETPDLATRNLHGGAAKARNRVQDTDRSEPGTQNQVARNLQGGAAKARKRVHDTDSSDPGTLTQATRDQPIGAGKSQPVVVNQKPSVQPPKPKPRSHPRTSPDVSRRQQQRHLEAEESEGLETGDSCDESGESARDMYRDSILALRSRPAALHQVI